MLPNVWFKLVTEDVSVTAQFFRGENGKIASITVIQGETTFQGKRVEG